MNEKKNFYTAVSEGKEATGKLTYKRNFLLGLILCFSGIAAVLYAFHIGVLSLVGIAIFLSANALFLAGIFQLSGVAEITCPMCGKMTGASRFHKEYKCRSCHKKIKIVKKKD